MTVEDAKSLSRTAQTLVVEARRGYGSPPSYDSVWQSLWGAKVDRIEINAGALPSAATIWFPELRWEQSLDVVFGDMIRIRTNEPTPAERTVVFAGFVTSNLSNFSGGSEKANSAYERNAIVCQSYRWLLSQTSLIFGCWARGPDDYTDYGEAGQAPIANSAIFCGGRRTIFNANGLADRDPAHFIPESGPEFSLFANPDSATYWTARDMLAYVMAPFHNRTFVNWQLPDPYELEIFAHSDWDKRLDHIVVDGLNMLAAIDLICKNIGWSFREVHYNDGSVDLTFSGAGHAAGYQRSATVPTILHQVHAEAAGGNLTQAVAEGRKILWSMSLAEDIGGVVNNPWGLGAPHRFEFTAELVPAWSDDDLIPDTSGSNANLYFTDADLQDITDPDSKPYYNKYHSRGADFMRNIGRKWCLNESGRYTGSSSFDRGKPYDFSTVIAAEYILNSNNKRNFAPFNRRLLPCLTVDPDSRNSVGVRVEFSFDAGSSWQMIPSSIVALDDECGLYITEPNLAEMVDKAESNISGGDLDKVQLNFWTSLCKDKIAQDADPELSFKEGAWNTRVRVTASVQMDQRLKGHSLPSAASGSPFLHSQIYDFSEKYGLKKRTASSSFNGSDLPAWDVDSSDWFSKHLGGIRRANEDMSISGRFVLDRLWLGDGSGEPAFALGDCIEKITGREYRLSASMAGTEVYPEIVKIIYLPGHQKMMLLTRDLRFAEGVL